MHETSVTSKLNESYPREERIVYLYTYYTIGGLNTFGELVRNNLD